MKQTNIIARTIHPWEFLKDELEARNMTQKEFAQLIQKSPAEVNHIIRWERWINADFAMRLAIIFGTSANLWLGLQNKRDLYVLKKKQSKNKIFNEIKENVSLLQVA